MVGIQLKILRVDVVLLFSSVFWEVFMYLCHRWTKAHDLLVEQKVRKDQLAEAVHESEARLRSEHLCRWKVFVFGYWEQFVTWEPSVWLLEQGRL